MNNTKVENVSLKQIKNQDGSYTLVAEWTYTGSAKPVSKTIATVKDGQAQINQEEYDKIVDYAENGDKLLDSKISAMKQATYNSNTTIPAGTVRTTGTTSEWFKRNKTKLVVGGLATALAISLLFNILPKGTDRANISVPEPTTSQPIETPEPTPSIEPAVIYISHDEVYKDVAELTGMVYDDWGFTNIEQRSINSFYYLVNQAHMDSATRAQLLQEGFVADDVKEIFKSAFQVSNAVSNVGTNYFANGTGAILDVTPFCKHEEDAEIVGYAYQSLCDMKKQETEDQFYNCFNWIAGYIDNPDFPTDYPIPREACSPEAQYVIDIIYGDIFREAGVAYGASYTDTEVVFPEFINKFDTIQSNVQACINEAINTQEHENNKGL